MDFFDIISYFFPFISIKTKIILVQNLSVYKYDFFIFHCFRAIYTMYLSKTAVFFLQKSTHFHNVLRIKLI